MGREMGLFRRNHDFWLWRSASIGCRVVMTGLSWTVLPGITRETGLNPSQVQSHPERRPRTRAVATVPEQIQARTRGQGKAYEKRDELRKMIAGLPERQIIRASPEEGESPRKLKQMVAEAGKDIDKKVKYVADGEDLLVFMPEPPDPTARKRDRPPKS